MATRPKQAREQVARLWNTASPTHSLISHLLPQQSQDSQSWFIRLILLSRMNLLNLRAHKRGIAVLEFALCAPVIILLMVATADIVFLLRDEFTLEQVSSQMGAVISQCKLINSPVDLARFDAEAQIIAGNVSLTAPAGSGNFIVTAIALNSKGAPIVQWQHMGGNQVYGSILCSGGSCQSGDAPNLPNGYQIPSGQVLISVEAVSAFSKWVFASNFLSNSQIKRWTPFFGQVSKL